MHKILEGFLIFMGICLILLGMVFVIAGETENLIAGGVMILIAVGLFLLVYYTERIKASKPTLVSQTFNVEMSGSGEFQKRELKCKNCGAPITDKDLKVIQGGIMATCPYCGTVSALEEEPKW